MSASTTPTTPTDDPGFWSRQPLVYDPVTGRSDPVGYLDWYEKATPRERRADFQAQLRVSAEKAEAAQRRATVQAKDALVRDCCRAVIALEKEFAAVLPEGVAKFSPEARQFVINKLQNIINDMTDMPEVDV